MCGIVGYVGAQQAAPILLEGLTRLEHRGYDSAGLALLGGTGIKVAKRAGRVRDLGDRLPKRFEDPRCSLGKVGRERDCDRAKPVGEVVQHPIELGRTALVLRELPRGAGLDVPVQPADDLPDVLQSARQVGQLGQVTSHTDQQPVMMYDVPTAIEQIGRLPVRGPGGRIFALSDLTRIQPEENAQGFYRMNGRTAVSAVTITKTFENVRPPLMMSVCALLPNCRKRKT